MGQYPKKKAFNVGVQCDEGVPVLIQFSGSTMSGHPDVLQNISDDIINRSIDSQLFYKDKPIVLNKTIDHIISFARSAETLPFTAAYDYNGESLFEGGVKGLSTITLTYN